MSTRITLICTFFFLLLSSCDKNLDKGSFEHIKNVTNTVDSERLINADNTPQDWLSYGRNYSEDRFSSLEQINRDNIDELGLVWAINLGTKHGFEATPLVVDGIIYVSGPWSIVYAIDARKGELLWTFDPEVPGEYGEIACCDVVNRGVAMYKGQIFVGALDGRLISIDASTGTKTWDVLTVDQAESYSITGAPRIIKGKVIIGNSGAELGVRGYITAYDALTGEQSWRFYTVPGDPSIPFESENMAEAAKTWTGEWWKTGGGGTVWDAMAYDPQLNLLYVGTGNGSLWNRSFRSPKGGDNLFLSSILAINPDTGGLVWHYQTTPGDTWDYTATQQIILADLKINGSDRKVLMQAPKNGFFYVLDRKSGELISADPYVYVNWATKVDLETGRPIETAFSRYENLNAQIFPGPGGGHNWQPMAYNPITGLVYIPAKDQSMVYSQPSTWEYNSDRRVVNLAVGSSSMPWGKGDKTDSTRMDPLAPVEKGKLIAWDPIKKKEVWKITHKTTWNAGVLSTKDLVFQGTAEGYFVAYDADKGSELWRYNVRSGVIAAPISYEIDGKQYITVVAGWGGVGGRTIRYTDQFYPGTIYTFALGENEVAPEFPTTTPELINLMVEEDIKAIENGNILFRQNCSRCHGKPGNGGGAFPDLAYSSKAIFEIFSQIVRDGAFLSKGMPNFGDRLDQNQIQNIKIYVLSAAKELRNGKDLNNQTNGDIH